MEKHKHKILSIQIEACKVYLVPIISSKANVSTTTTMTVTIDSKHITTVPYPTVSILMLISSPSTGVHDRVLRHG